MSEQRIQDRFPYPKKGLKLQYCFHNNDNNNSNNDDDDNYNNNDNNNNNDDDHNRIQRRNSRFLTISSLRRELSHTRTLKWPGRICVQITRNTSSAYPVQHVVLRAT